MARHQEAQEAGLTGERMQSGRIGAISKGGISVNSDSEDEPPNKRSHGAGVDEDMAEVNAGTAQAEAILSQMPPESMLAMWPGGAPIVEG